MIVSLLLSGMLFAQSVGPFRDSGPKVSVCEVVADPASFDEKVVRIATHIVIHMTDGFREGDQFKLRQAACDGRAIEAVLPAKFKGQEQCREMTRYLPRGQGGNLSVLFRGRFSGKTPGDHEMVLSVSGMECSTMVVN